MQRIMATLVALCLAGTALAHGVTSGTIEVIHPNIPEPPKGAKSAAGYMAISNAGAAPDRLIGVESPIAARAMLHRTEFGADGVARMIHLASVDLPADDTVLLEPGGIHVMFMGLQVEMTEGDLLPATLIFEKAGRVEVEFMVDPPGGLDHSQMDHSALDPDAPGQDGPLPPPAGGDVAAIEALLRAQFDRPGAPLAVAPVTVQGDVAVAGWSQGETGGRAFLRRDAQGWFIVLCSGESLVLPASFQAMGLGRAAAEDLARAVASAESAATADLIARLDAFEGTMFIGRAGTAGHGQGAAAGN